MYRKIQKEETFTNFNYVFYDGDYVQLFASYAKTMGAAALPNLIEKTDGFHPSQAGNALFAKTFFSWFEQNHPDALGDINPHNAEIDALFGTK